MMKRKKHFKNFLSGMKIIMQVFVGYAKKNAVLVMLVEHVVHAVAVLVYVADAEGVYSE